VRCTHLQAGSPDCTLANADEKIQLQNQIYRQRQGSNIRKNFYQGASDVESDSPSFKRALSREKP
jgi:hypothetical protein